MLCNKPSMSPKQLTSLVAEDSTRCRRVLSAGSRSLTKVPPHATPAYSSMRCDGLCAHAHRSISFHQLEVYAVST